MTVCVDCLGALDDNLFHKLCCGVHEAGNGHGIQVHKVEPIVDRWAVRGHATCSVLGLLKTVPGLCEMDQKRPCVGCLKLMKCMA